MRAYLYDVKTGVYEGETFEEAAMLAFEEGITAVPPPAYGQGQVPVFDRQRQVWEVVPATVARQLLRLPQRPDKERNDEHV